MVRVRRWLTSICLLGSALCLWSGSYEFVQACPSLLTKVQYVSGWNYGGFASCTIYTAETCMTIATAGAGFDDRFNTGMTIRFARMNASECGMPLPCPEFPSKANGAGGISIMGSRDSAQYECFDFGA